MKVKHIHPEYNSPEEKDAAIHEAMSVCLAAVKQKTEAEENKRDP